MKDFGCQTEIWMSEISTKSLPKEELRYGKRVETKEEIVKEYCKLTLLFYSLCNIVNEYKFKLYHLINNPRVSVEIQWKNKILEPYIFQEKKTLHVWSITVLVFNNDIFRIPLPMYVK